jgi:hypothetical protein
MPSIFSREKPLYRKRRYGLSLAAFKLLALLWLALIIGVIEFMELRGDKSFELVLYGGGLLPPLIFYVWSERRAARLKKHDRQAAAEAIKRPLRNARQIDGRVVDFDPHYPHVLLGGDVSCALDPRRRLMRMIVSDMIDAQGQPLDETGPASGDIVAVSQKTIPGKRRWFWLLPPRAKDRRTLVTVTSRGTDGKDLVLPFRFTVDDPAAFGWYQTFMLWMRDDRQHVTVKA